MDSRTLVAEFEEHRPRMLAIATRVLGSRTDAEDAVQEAWLRMERQEDPIDNVGGWLTRVVGRICIDMIRSRSARPASPVEDWSIDLAVSDDTEKPEEAAVLAESLGVAMLVVLDSLGPEERLAFVLHDVFAVPFAEIATVVGRTRGAAKMLASRARRKVRDVPRPTGGLQRRREVVDAFLGAARDGDFDALLAVLDPGVTWHLHTPHGRETRVGANEVLRAVRRGDPARIEARRVSVNGEPGILALGPGGKPLALMACTVTDGRIADIHSIADPALLRRLAPPPQ